MADLPTITELRETAARIEVGNFTLEHWRDGTYFLESPTGEGTQVTKDLLEYHLRHLFRECF